MMMITIRMTYKVDIIILKIFVITVGSSYEHGGDGGGGGSHDC